jgi:hypothetical protein
VAALSVHRPVIKHRLSTRSANYFIKKQVYQALLRLKIAENHIIKSNIYFKHFLECTRFYPSLFAFLQAGAASSILFYRTLFKTTYSGSERWLKF